MGKFEKKKSLPERIVKAYQVHRSIRKVASIVGVSYGYAHAILKSHRALLPWSGFDRVKRSTKGRRGAVSRYLEAHPGAVLPQRNSDIVKLIRCDIEDVHSWKVARWAKFKRLVKRSVPAKIIRSWRFGRCEVEFIDGRTLGYDEMVELDRQLQEGKEK